jgi:DNA-binding beta-propeller fold protein YncE
MRKAVLIWLVVCPSLIVCPASMGQTWPPFPHPTGLTSRPFSIRNIWYIGGTGPWDTMTMDPAGGRLYIAHGPVVQVVEVQTGAVAGEIKGLAGARAIALDSKGQYGYISDGPGSRVVVFDPGSLDTVASILTKPDPRSLVYEPLSGLVFVVQTAPPAPQPPPEQTRRTGPRAQAGSSRNPKSYITIIDPQLRSVVGWILVSGVLGEARTDGAGQVYIGYTSHDAVIRFNAQAVAAELPHSPIAAGNDHPPQPGEGRPVLLDWTGAAASRTGSGFHELRLGQGCAPRGLALDGRDARLFAACDNMTLEVINTATSQEVTTIPIGAGVNEIAYDPVHGYIFAADGAGDGTLTVIRRDAASDSYAIVQNLPTRQRAYVMAVDADSGAVYMVTDLEGVDLSKPGGIGTMRMTPVNGSFQVIEIGN